MSWCEEDCVELEPAYRGVLAAVCRVHSGLQVERGDVDITLRSLHRLRDATEMVMHHQAECRAIDVETALRWTLSGTMTDNERAVLDRLVAGAAPA